MSMILAFHGGMCCGIKTIYQLLMKPSDFHLSIDNTSCKRNNHDIMYEVGYSNRPFFIGKAPEETGVDRIKRYIDYVCAYRPDHIIEVVTAQGAYHPQNNNWSPVLLELGFKEVTSALNSNSGNTVHVYHLIIKGGKPVKE